jgi:hypothetical protein
MIVVIMIIISVFGTIEGKTSSEVFFAFMQICKIDTLFTVQPWPEIS